MRIKCINEQRASSLEEIRIIFPIHVERRRRPKLYTQVHVFLYIVYIIQNNAHIAHIRVQSPFISSHTHTHTHLEPAYIHSLICGGPCTAHALQNKSPSRAPTTHTRASTASRKTRCCCCCSPEIKEWSSSSVYTQPSIRTEQTILCAPHTLSIE